MASFHSFRWEVFWPTLIYPGKTWLAKAAPQDDPAAAVRDSAAISACNSPVIWTSAAFNDGSSYSRLRAPMIGHVAVRLTSRSRHLT
jgi:hypothetical protein